MKKKLILAMTVAVMSSILVVPAVAASLNSSDNYNTSTDYSTYVQSLIDDGLITPKGAEELLRDNNEGTYGNCGSQSFSGCYGQNRGCGGYNRQAR